MPKFAANLGFLFTEIDFLDRFSAASNAGFKGVECPIPYDYDKEALAGRLEENDLTQVLINMPAGDWAAGERGIACHPDRVGEFQDGIGKAIDYATELRCRQVNCLAGVTPEGISADRLQATFVSNLQFASAELKAAGIKLLIECINTIDIPGFFLSRTSQALELFSEVDVDNLFLQYDIYHMQIMEGDLARTIEKNKDVISHLQIADNPGRHEPGTGEIDYPFLFSFLDNMDYRGWIGCEYIPGKTTLEGLRWLAPYRD